MTFDSQVLFMFFLTVTIGLAVIAEELRKIRKILEAE